MDLRYVFACGVVWCGTADAEAGWQLIRALRDPDAQVRSIARAMLADKADSSLPLLNAATAAGLISGEEAAGVVAALLAQGGGVQPECVQSD